MDGSILKKGDDEMSCDNCKCHNCDNCSHKIFSEAWFDFINHYIDTHPEFYEDYKIFIKKKKAKGEK